MKNPANLFSPAPGEAPCKKEMSEDGRLRIRSLISQDEASIADLEGEKIAAVKVKEAQQTAGFLAQAASTGYRLPNDSPEKKRIRVTLTMHNLYPFVPGTEAECMIALKAELGGNGAA